MRAAVSDVLTVAGLLIVTISVVGVVRLPDVYTQLHAASKASFLGVALLLAAAAVEGNGTAAARAGLTIALLAVTTPVASHAVARAAARAGEEMRTAGTVDERRSAPQSSDRRAPIA